MNEPVIQADTSLILNGDFSQGLTQWTKGSHNSHLIATQSDWYEGERIRYLFMQDGASVSQSMGLPVDRSADARYVLSFLCENRHTAPGQLVIRVDGSGEQLDIELLADNARDSAEDQLRRDAGQPLEFIPRFYEVELALPLQHGGAICINVVSPVNRPSDVTSGLCITRIQILVHLGPLVLERLVLDGQVLSPDRPLYLCVGAVESMRHRFFCVPVAGNPWLNTEAALVSDDNPQGAIIATPAWGVDQPLSANWHLDAPLMTDQEPVAFSISLLNRYTAQAYSISASFGHHRLVFRDVLEAAYYPVVEYGQSVRVGVLVASYYTGQPLGGRTVTWTHNAHRVQAAVTSDDSGWAYFDYEPPEAGDFELIASVESLYYTSGVATQSVSVRALATDPWDDLKVVVEGQELLWDDVTGYPNRGSAYPLQLKLPPDSPLWGTDLYLKWEGDSPDRLGVTVSPALESAVPVADEAPEWILTCEDRLDGRFDLRLGCSKLLLPSARKPMSLARNLVSIGEVRDANRSPVVDEQESVLLRLQVVHMIASGNGDPVVNALVEWDGPNGSVATVTGAGGWASVLDVPHQAGTYTITARVRAHEHMAPVERPFAVTAQATSPWKGEARFYLDDVEVDPAVGIACRLGRSHVFRVAPRPGSPAQDQPMTLRINVQEPGLGLTIGAPTATADGGWQWPLTSTGASQSGMFVCGLLSDVWTQERMLSGRLLSQNLADEVTVVLDQVPATLGAQTLYPCLGALHRFNVLPHALSPLVGLDAKLKWSGTSAEQLGATVDPALSVAQAFSDGGALWLLDFSASQQRGEFSLALELPQLNLTSAANAMELGHNKVRIALAHEPAVDPVVGQDRAWMWTQVISAYTRQPVAQVPVTWSAGQNSQTLETDARGWSGFGLLPAVAQTQEVKVSVLSRYDGFEETRNMTVKVLAQDPWKGIRIRFDGQPEQPWGSKTYFPRRKGTHSIEVLAEAGSPLFGHDLTLGLTGTGPAALGLDFMLSPLGAPRWFSSAGLLYEFKCDDLRDGSFALRLAATRLANLSPANAMSLGTGSQVLKLIVENRVQQTLDWGQALYEQVSVVSAISGKPLAGMTVTWESPDLGVITSQTDFYGVARLHFKPLTAGAGTVKVTVGDHVYSESVSLAFVVNEPREIAALTRATADGYPGEEVEAQATVVSTITGQPLSGVEVMWDYAGASLAPTLTDAQGKATVRFRLGMPGTTVLDASVRGGEGGWDMKSLLITTLEDALRLDDLIVDQANSVIGETASARAKVVYDRGGIAAPDVRVNWRFAQLQLAPSLTNGEGLAPVEFKLAQVGTFSLVATLEGDPSTTREKQLSVVKPVRMMSQFRGGGTYPVGGAGAIKFRVISLETGEPIENQEIFWVVREVEDSTRSGPDGWVDRAFSLSPGSSGYLQVRVYIKDSQGGVADQQFVTMQFVGAV